MKFKFTSNSSDIFNANQVPEKRVDQQSWNDWTWQLRQSYKKKSDFEQYFKLSDFEALAFDEKIFNIRTTPYYAQLADRFQPNDPIRKILMPHSSELNMGTQAQLDPLGERKKKNNPTSRVIHRYSDRALFLVTDICSVYCRYCTRKHFTGHDLAFIKEEEFNAAIDYFKSKNGLREIILSGGDPLTLSDALLEKVLKALREIDHIEIIRIGSRMPVVTPMRITESLVKMIKKYKPVYLMTHFNHPKEITQEAALALEMCVDHGIPVMNQMVLLNGVNNHPAIVQALSRRLLYLRVKPYYMFQCDPSQGTDHLRTTIEDSLNIQKELWGHLSGLAMPQLSLDIPDGGGKAYYVPQFETQATQEKRTFEGWDGVKAEYINPPSQKITMPADIDQYISEWNEIKNNKL